ncbi:uncharacterized protein ppp1r3ab [Fundulus heteroclitus]|uniref:uncharacterized protein ppp1r3ab n=1 Tax=Fundulus heteroclitus TaxID=8078 RepID=UPI00165B09E2|nr:uncharacterized protein ppp1r3ab [Fundulus heteroclitus]
MEFAGRLRPSEACNYLEVPGLSGLDPDEDEGDLIVGFRPKSSPIPSRRSSVSDEDSDPEPPLCGSRRVSFADAKGLSLVQVKEFALWDVPKLPGHDSADGEGKDLVEYHLSPLTFSLPLSPKDVRAKVLDQKVELETIGLLPGTTILKGVIRVLNISYNKSVFIRTSLDRWVTHFDLLAEYVPGSSDGVTDSFSFKLTLVPPLGDQGVRVDFCLRYETPAGTFWANNTDRNYVVSCQRGMREGTEKPQRESANKKSCLKAASQSVSTVESISSKPASTQENMSTDESVRALEVGASTAKRISEGQSATSNGEGQTLSVENKQNGSRRRQRKAARMARLRDYYAQRDDGGDDACTDKGTSETKQATCKAIPGDRVVGLQPFDEGKIQSQCPQVVFEALEACSTPLHNPAHDHTSTKQMKSDLLVLARGESASDISNNPLLSAREPTPAEQQNVGEIVTTNQDTCMTLACTNNSATPNGESLISRNPSFPLGSVVAPLYHQAFQRGAGENNALNTRDFNLPCESRQACDIVPINTRSSMGKVQANLTDTQGSNVECLAVNLISPTSEGNETVDKTPRCADIVQNPTEMEKNQNQPDQSSTDTSPGQQCLLEDSVPPESVNSQTDAQKEIMAYEVAKPPQCQSSEQNPSIITANVDETLAQDESKACPRPVQIMPGHVVEGAEQLVNGEINCECPDVNKDDESRKTDTTFVEDNFLQVFDELDSNQTESEGCLNSLVYICKPERTDLTSLDVSLETDEDRNMENKDVFASETGNESNFGRIKAMYEVAQSIMNEVRSSCQCHADMSGTATGQNVLEKKGQCETDSSFLKQDEDFLLIDVVEGKNWETMVEEEEDSVLSKEGELLNLKTEANETDEKVEERTDIKVDDAEVLENQGCIGQKCKQVNVMKTERTESTEVEKMDGQEGTELQNVTELQSVSADKSSVEDEREKMEIDMKQDDLAQLINENGEQKNADFQDIFHVSEGGEIVIIDADSDMAMRNREAELGSDFSQNKVGDGLPALVGRAPNADTSERQQACIQTDTLQSDDTGVQSSKDATGDPSNADTERSTSEGGMCDSADDPDSASGDSDSDEELLLYVHCLRASGAPAQIQKDKIRDAGFKALKRPSISRGKVPPRSMPSICEAVDEEPQHGSPPEIQEGMKTAAEATSDPQESINPNEWRWKDLFSCSNASKTLLYASLIVIFTVVAYHYDFLACFLLYLISVIWLCCQGESQLFRNK